jgi:polar amino acid transport system substrate-binding protein
MRVSGESLIRMRSVNRHHKSASRKDTLRSALVVTRSESRRRRKAIAAISSLLTASVCVLASACSSGSSSSTPASTGASNNTSGSGAESAGVVAAARNLLPTSVKQSGTLSDYVNIPYIPMEFYAPGTQNPEGVDIGIAEAIGQVLGVKINFTNVSFPDLFTSLQSGRSQFVISGAYDAPSRRDAFEYIDYFKTGTPILTTKANVQKYHITDFSAFCGKTLATGSGTDYIQEIQALSKKYCGSSTSVGQVLASSNAQDYLNVVDGRAVAAFDEGSEAAQYFLNHQQGVPDAGQWELVGPTYYPTDYGIILPKDSALEPALIAAMKAIISNGQYAQVLAKWGVSSDALAQPTLNAGPPIP